MSTEVTHGQGGEPIIDICDARSDEFSAYIDSCATKIDQLHEGIDALLNVPEERIAEIQKHCQLMREKAEKLESIEDKELVLQKLGEYLNDQEEMVKKERIALENLKKQYALLEKDYLSAKKELKN